jgi:hypothetical protein
LGDGQAVDRMMDTVVDPAEGFLVDGTYLHGVVLPSMEGSIDS